MSTVHELWDYISFAYWDSYKKTIHPVKSVDAKSVKSFHNLEQQIQKFDKNMKSFASGGPFLHTLLWGEMGCGKSSVAKSVIASYQGQVKAIQLRLDQIIDLPALLDTCISKEHRYVLYIDEISLARDVAEFYFLKTFMDGGFVQVNDNVMLLATSNRRHLTQEYQSDNTGVTVKGDVLHFNDDKNEALALSDRFGLTISFYSLSRADYLELVFKESQKDPCLNSLTFDTVKSIAIDYAMQKGGTNGRTAMQCIDYIKIMHSDDDVSGV